MPYICLLVFDICMFIFVNNVYVSERKKSAQNRKTAKIGNQYNQAPHLTLYTNGKVTTSQLDITNESQEVSPFPSR